MRTLFFFLVLATSLSLNAQITKGNWMVGGNGSFSSSTASSEDSSGNEFESKTTSLRLNPNIGYFLTDKFAIGLAPYFGYGNPEGSDNSNWSLGIGPFARYYFLKPENRINIFSEANLSYSAGLSEINKERTSLGYRFSAGTVLFFNSSVGIELSINYIDSTSKRDEIKDSEFNQIFIGLGFQIHLEK